MATFKNQLGTHNVDLPQDAVDAMHEVLGELYKSCEKCILPFKQCIGRIDDIAYGVPRSCFSDDSGENVLHWEHSELLTYDLLEDIKILEGIKKMREQVIRLGYSARTNTDHLETSLYGDLYEKIVPASELRKELQKLLSRFGRESS